MTRERRVIVACCGGSYPGQLACHGAVRLAREGYGDLVGVAAVAAGHRPGIERVRAADDIVVIDGCETGCARAVLDQLGIEPDQYIVVADLPLRSTGYLGIDPRDIDAVVSAGWVRDSAVCNPRRRRNHGAD
ncbi:putative zinc-binding protein [Methanoculleus taiwanensis]|uniref:putative zinc-binding protein n=1 Tax=Methanoculleus taiwanensis TaxID=1550565 RepID=UPI0013E8E495|nr:putative zinc-binding protein [Methanoculleus taiwanensis]